jgi:hypothetical protein
MLCDNETLGCINDKTYDVADIVEKAHSRDHKSNDPLFWKKNISHFMFGKLQTLSRGYNLGTDWFNSLNLTLNNTHKYFVWIHDTKFFLASMNSDVIPPG